MDTRATTNLNVHVEKETICGCTCTLYIPLPNQRIQKDGTLERGKMRDQNLMCLGQCTTFLLKYPKGSVLTNIYADNGVSKVSLDISLNGILRNRVRYNKKSKYFHEIWVHQAENVNHCAALHFNQGEEFDYFDKTLSSILCVLRDKEHTLESEYRLVAFKPLHGKVAKTDTVTKSIEDICTEGPDPGPDPAPATRGPVDAQAAIGVPFSPAPYTPPSDVLTVYKNKVILKNADRFTFDSSDLKNVKETSPKKSGIRRPIKSDSSLFQKMPSLNSIKRECVALNEKEFAEKIYTYKSESGSIDSDKVDGSINTKLDYESTEQLKPVNENSELYENVFLPIEGGNDAVLETDQSQSPCQSSSTDFNTTVFLPMEVKKNVPLETEQSQNSCQSSSTDFNTTVFVPMEGEKNVPLETEQSQSSCQSSSTDFNTTVYVPMEGETNVPLETEQSQSSCQSSSTDFNTTVFVPMEGKKNVPLETDQSQLSPSDFNTTVFLPMTGSNNVVLGTEKSQTGFNSTVYPPKSWVTKQNNSENNNKTTDEENMLQITLLEEAINSCNMLNAEKYAAKLAKTGVNVTITIKRK